MVVVVVAVAASGTRTAGALAALWRATWFDFFLTRPYQRFTIADGDEVQTAVLLFVVGLMVSQLAVRTRRLQAVVVTDAAHLSSLQGTARLVEGGCSPEAVVEYVRRELVGLLGLRGCRFEYGTLMGRLPRLEHDGSVWLRRGSRITEYADWPEGETELRGGRRRPLLRPLAPRCVPRPPSPARGGTAGGRRAGGSGRRRPGQGRPASPGLIARNSGARDGRSGLRQYGMED
ncbi:DUF4118 domain-containing protein [Streptomyces sp. MS1.HAVA.3]|uniref:DUF4118 domain-containing protein n=1 Tax=Streptomyces caledonius TaxID=3134107 RepID=A0ABU8UDT3_9ACTN